MSWAFATSPAPYGLGLTDRQCWGYTPREFTALEEIRRNYLVLWAIERAEYRNVNFRGEDSTVWTIEQVLGEARRKQPQQKMHPAFQQALIDHAMNKMPDWIDRLDEARKQ